MSLKKLILLFPAALIVFTCTVAAQDQTKIIQHTSIKPSRLHPARKCSRHTVRFAMGRTAKAEALRPAR